MKKILVSFVCISIILALFISIGCGKDEKDANTSSWRCPTIYDNITWKSYGPFSMNNAGRDSAARRIITECGWHVFNGHNGGYGDTLQIASVNEEVVLVWAYNDFYGFRVVNGWQGATEKGAKIGISNLTDFLIRHPEFYYVSAGLYEFDNGYEMVRAYFNQNGYLEKLIVGYYFRN